ncbi:MAG: tyrosine-type recombinase/integrase [Acidimicrobiales bacterium]|jgi:integrase|nr:tyrosine-type recombinase/integrase [Acidimicrobiales bacterium]
MRRTARGSIRERRPGVWELRIAVGAHPVTGRTLTRSVTFHGDRGDAAAYAAELAGMHASRRARGRAAPFVTVGDLLARWLEADHRWKPSTYGGYRYHARHLTADVIGARRVCTLTAGQVRDAMRRWQAAGASESVIAGRFRALRAAISWAYDEHVIDVHPIRAMRGPRRSEPRRPLTDTDLARLLHTAETRVLEAVANDDHTRRAARRRHRAEQDLLLVRLAADTGARRGELTALRFTDLDGRVLHIARAVSDAELTTPKSGRDRALTVGTSTAQLWHTLARDWQDRLDADTTLGPWVFSPSAAHQQRLTPSGLGQRFTRLRNRAHTPDATLHRLRHSVATFLVTRGQVLHAQARLGHADPATTLREYAYALPLTDQPVADAIDHHLDHLDDVRVTGSDDASTPRHPNLSI